MTTGGRLSKAARREDLLRHAAALVECGGPAAITMEGLAAKAGVSKALPYAHFENAGAVLLALHDQEIQGLARAVEQAVEPFSEREPRVRAGIHAYVDVVSRRGHVIAQLMQASPPRAPRGDTPLEWFLQVFLAGTTLPTPVARTAATAYLSAVNGALIMWGRGDTSRTILEETLVRLIVDGIAGLEAADAATRTAG